MLISFFLSQFEAQRPIDTLTTKHTLHFSHFSRTEGQGDKSGSSTLAHFSFVPIERQDVRSQSTDSSLTASSNDPFMTVAAATSTSTSQQESFTPTAYPSSTLQVPTPVVHVDDENRLVQRTVTSSVNLPPRLASRSDSSQFTDVSSPMDWRETSNYSARLVSDEDAGRAQGRGYEGFNASAPQLVGHWSEPIASSSAAYDSDYNNNSEGNEETRHRDKTRHQYKKPTYRFHLDPLDSFETWILTLTLQRKSDSIASLRGMSRPLRWEKPVAAGLDRVFRDWFHSNTDEISKSLGGGDGSFYRASLIASAANPYSIPNTSSYFTNVGKSTQRDKEEEEEGDQQQPGPKVLEFDGTSCTMTIQPHAVASFSSLLHPALTLMPSQHYLSNAGLSSHSFSSRAEFNFHCESLTINASRLLNVLEDVERDAEKASELARKRGAHIVVGSSGSTTWAYSTGGSRFLNDGNSHSTQWTGTRGESGVSVLVFGAVRD